MGSPPSTYLNVIIHITLPYTLTRGRIVQLNSTFTSLHLPSQTPRLKAQAEALTLQNDQCFQHGIARTARSRTEEQRQQDLVKIQKYRSLEDDIRQKISDNNYGPETFQLTSKLLRLNPEYYTIWNARRRCLIYGLLSKPSAGLPPSKASQSISVTDTHTSSPTASLPSSSTETPPRPNSPTVGKTGTTIDSDADTDTDVIRAELGFTVPLLMGFPKCYWIWNYRLWTLDRAIERLDISIARRIWEEELGLVSKMLTKDRRNFHAWGYRRHVVAQLESPVLKGQSLAEPEFQYTTEMIHKDLSNFSAWHNRSQLIARLLNERKADDESRKAFLDKGLYRAADHLNLADVDLELELVREALNVGPEDQSLWYYHQFLVLNLADPTSNHQIAPKLTVEERKSYIDREVTDIKDLLEDYHDIKWIYGALVEYSAALTQLSGQPLESASQSDVASWLEKLRRLDPKRNGRWGDLEKELGLSHT
ncbi:geranylgeranyl transferase type-2 subunit beta [Fusarium austroafricanum]|uniref:Geranylgeranyl transferase type-2 subunit alpha n=1 Tax=Fusarium austroafricanum TaxID=2364996 RepID=A0A8H4P3K0_9HYPO|nr:geranylgeranyl transferase type-2 subunit beta [Fusarium austroafricanum]